MLTRLTRDTWNFSGAKNYQQLRDTTLALKGPDGKARSFEDFKAEARKINKQYNNTWLRTEYDSAINSSTMAARWVEFQADAEDAPYLQYETAGDTNVRTDHAKLDGVIRKIDDPFWGRYFPPNGWNCRCTVIQLATEFARETENPPQVPISRMFKTNLAKSGLVYPETHPYYSGVPESVLRQSVQTLPDDIAYKATYINEETGGTVRMHILHAIDEQANNNLMARALADNGYKPKLLPVLGKEDDNIRKLLYRTDDFIKGKNPDALIGKDIFEFKLLQSTSYKSIQKNIYKASKQAHSVYLQLPVQLNLNDIEMPVKGIFNQSKSIKQVWIMNGEELIKMQNPNY